jgi:hypothetical protein
MRRRTVDMLTEKEGICRDPWSNKQQTTITAKDLRVLGSANHDIKICKFCMCVQRGEMPSKDQTGFKNSEMGHFSSSRILPRFEEKYKTANHDIKICHKLTKYMQIMISIDIKIYQDKQSLISRFVNFSALEVWN